MAPTFEHDAVNLTDRVLQSQRTFIGTSVQADTKYLQRIRNSMTDKFAEIDSQL